MNRPKVIPAQPRFGGPFGVPSLPAGSVQAGEPISVFVDAVAEVLDVLIRREGRPSGVVRGTPLDRSAEGLPQRFLAVLPALASGERMDYRVEARRPGRTPERMPTDGNWISVVGAAQSASPRTREPSPLAGPRFSHDLEYFATLSATLRSEFIGPTPEGLRANFFIDTGRVVGPKIEADLLRDGGDWMVVRPDGIGMLGVTVTYRTTEGALILERASGVIDFGEDGYDRVASRNLSGSAPFYATPLWSTADPAWKWLNREQGYSFGFVDLSRLHAETDIYLPRVRSNTPHG